MRQAFAGLLWSKQFYHYVVRDWLNGDPATPPPPAARRLGRNHDWMHLFNADVISMPDKWEYPWYAAWDLAFHCLPLALIDSEFAKEQLVLLLREWYMHPNGQMPAYEWNFSDVNPPVHAWAAWRVYKIEAKRSGKARPRVPGAHLPQAAAEFHLVGEPQGRRGQERLSGRLSGPRQHRRLRPQRAASRRRLRGTGRWHRLDGDVQPEPDGHRAGIGAAKTRPTKTWPASSGSTFSTSPTPSTIWAAATRHVGRSRRLLLRRAAPAGRAFGAAQGALDGGPDSALRRGDAGAATWWSASPASSAAWSGSSRIAPI